MEIRIIDSSLHNLGSYGRPTLSYKVLYN